MPPRALRVLSPLPLLDEQALLRACSECDPPVAPQHATTVWKALLRLELDEYHPLYAERLRSRLASRAASRAASRTGSRRPSMGGAAGDAPVERAAPAIAEGDETEEKEVEAEPVEAEPVEAGMEEKKEDGSEDKTEVESSLSPRSDSSASSVESQAARFAALQAAKQRLEAEDDAQLEGLQCFPRSRYAPDADELADPDHPVHNVRAITPETVPGLPARMYPMLASKFSMLTSRLVSHKTSADGSTTKLLIRLADGQHIESVIMRHKAGDVATGRVEQRITLCVSSQCTFCATGTMGMRGNLMMGEIVEQLLIANRFEKIRNIVFMSADTGTRAARRSTVRQGGEPLKNYDAVLSAIRGMTDGSRFGLAPSRITLSTVGVVPNMLQLTRDMPSIQLALSLHAPTQELRQQIVPTAKSWPLDKLIDAMDYFILRSKKRILIEYVMLQGVNDGEEQAHQLGLLLKGKDVMINLIPYNSTSVAANYRAPSREHCLHFQSILQNSYGLFTTTRVEMGADIEGACGQLALENQNLVLKPRGLADDLALPSEDMMPPSAAALANAQPGSPPVDIEDFMGSPPAGKRAAAPAAAVLSKRRGRATAAADTDAGSTSAAASPTASASAAASCCAGEDSSCECKPAASATTTAGAATTTATDESQTGSESDDEVTVGEILAREGIARRAGPIVAGATASLDSPAAPFLTPAEVERLRVRETLRNSWDKRERLQLVVFALAVLTLLAILRHSFAT